MNIIVIFVSFCVVLSENDAKAESTGGCEPLSTTLTAKKTDRKAWNKCIEYQEKLVYPCEDTPVSSLAGSQSRANHCHIRKVEPLLDSSQPIPHMAMLGFGEPLSRVGWLCGATLVSEKFLLAPANCKDIFGEIPVTYARIGVQKYNDSSEEKIFKINVELSHHVVPACLPVDDTLKDDIALSSYLDTNRKLQKRIRKKLSHEACSAKFPPSDDLLYGVNSTTHACYEDQTPSNTTCVDTLGGALNVINPSVGCMYTVVGIAAFGVTCAFDVHVVIKVAPYVPWIESVVWPLESESTISSSNRNRDSSAILTKPGNFGISHHWNRYTPVFLILSVVTSVFLLTV